MATFTAQLDGMGNPAVFQDGVYRSPDECARLLAVFRLSASAGDWFAPFAADLADALEAAMTTAAEQSETTTETAQAA